jgi:hypothetical protein
MHAGLADQIRCHCTLRGGVELGTPVNSQLDPPDRASRMVEGEGDDHEMDIGHVADEQDGTSGKLIPRAIGDSKSFWGSRQVRN